MTHSSDCASEITSCMIVGGGITGLITATILQQQGISVTVLDKGKGIGGRLATRRISHQDSIEGVFDYGTQYFTVKDPQFQVWVDDWLKQGVIKEWCQGFGTVDGKSRYCGVNGIRGVAKYLAQNLDIHTNTRVVKINYEKNWQVQTENNQQYQSQMLLLTSPVPQSLELLDASSIVLPSDVRSTLENISYERCIAVLALLEKSSKIPAPGGVALSDKDLVWLADNHQKGISPQGYAVTIHGSSSFSNEYWHSDDAEIAYKLLTAAADYLDSPVLKYQVHRWRYSIATTCHQQAYCALSNIPLVMAGGGFAAPKIEGAVLSGIATAKLIADRLNKHLA